MLIKDNRVENIIRKNSIRPHRFANSINAFWIGGVFGAIGQGLYILYSQIMKFSVNDSSMLVSLTLIFFGVIFTAIGTFDNFARFSGAGSFIPIVGFANAMSSSALEGKSEGMIFGIGGKIFSLVGSVFAYGIFMSYLCGFVYFLMWVMK